MVAGFASLGARRLMKTVEQIDEQLALVARQRKSERNAARYVALTAQIDALLDERLVVAAS